MPPAFLTTARLDLRPHAPGDEAYLVALNADPEVVRYTGDVAFADPAAAAAVVASLAAQFAQRRLGRLVAVDRATGQPIGWCGLKWHEGVGAADLGFRLHRAEWGRGYATEAGRACLDHADTIGMSVFAQCMPANVGSVRVLEKLGFIRASAPDADGFAKFVRAAHT